MGIKKDIVKLMGSLFGKETADTFEYYYEEENPEELVEACKKMLEDLLGKDSARKQLDHILKKYPKIKLEVSA